MHNGGSKVGTPSTGAPLSVAFLASPCDADVLDERGQSGSMGGC